MSLLICLLCFSLFFISRLPVAAVSLSFLATSFFCLPFFPPGFSSRISEAEIGTEVRVSPPSCSLKVTSISGISSEPSDVSGVMEIRIP